GVVVFLLPGRRQRLARQIKAQSAQRLGAVAVGDARELGDEDVLVGRTAPGRTEQAHAVARRAALVLERAVARDVGRVLGKALQPHRAAHAMRAGDDAKTDAAGCGAHRELSRAPPRRLRRLPWRVPGPSPSAPT